MNNLTRIKQIDRRAIRLALLFSLFATLGSFASRGVVWSLIQPTAKAATTFTVNIVDPSTTSVLSVNSSSQLEGNSGNTNHVITVTLSPASGNTVTVNYRTVAMTATSGVDFQTVSGMLTFPPGTSSQTVSVPVIGDTIDEPDEMFRLELSNAVNAGISVSSNPPRATIVDDDPPPSVSINDVGVVEPTSGTANAVFTVSLSSPSSLAVTVNFTTADGTATAGQDYQSTSGTVGFSAGETSKTVTVVVNSDAIAEPLERFFLNLTGPVNGTLSDAQGTATIGSPNSAGVGFSAPSYQAVESDHAALITIVRSGDTSSALSIDYGTVNGTASDKSDYTTAIGTLQFAGNESSKTFLVLLSEDAFQEGNESVGLTLSNISSNAFIVGPNSSVLTIGDSTTSTNNPIDAATGFVRQHYHDFLNREPDANGFNFWVNQITSCGSDVQCTEVRRIDVSASFFLSIEFQQSGYLVERFYKVGYGDATGTSTFGSNHQLAVPIVRFIEFLKDTQRIGQGVIVLQAGWEQALENNKQAYALEFVQTTRFTTALPATLTPAQFVDRLNQNSGNVLSSSERTTAINLFGGAADSSNVTARAQAVRMVAEDTDLYNAEFNRAFVLAEYFGYLRRNPNDAPDADYTGYDFWLTKLNQFNGNYINAEMVKAFLSSIEYRQRFGN